MTARHRGFGDDGFRSRDALCGDFDVLRWDMGGGNRVLGVDSKGYRGREEMKIIALLFTIFLAVSVSAQCKLSAYQKLDDEQKVEFWQKRFLAAQKDDRLTYEQAGIAREIATFVDLETIRATKSEFWRTDRGERLLELQGAAVKRFSKKQLREIFTANSGDPRTEGDCACSVGSSFNSCDYTCAGNSGCSPISEGCGFLGFYPCDGRCAG